VALHVDLAGRTPPSHTLLVGSVCDGVQPVGDDPSWHDRARNTSDRYLTRLVEGHAGGRPQ